MKINVIGTVAVIESAITVDQLKTIKRYRPELLTLYDADKKPQYVVDIAECGPGSLSRFGASYSMTASANGKATITMQFDDPTNSEEIANALKTEYAGALLKLSKVEEQYANALAEIAADEAAVTGFITVA